MLTYTVHKYIIFLTIHYRLSTILVINFQCIISLDTAFMFIIAGLVLTKIFQNRHPTIHANAFIAFFSFAVVIFFTLLGIVRSINIYNIILLFILLAGSIMIIETQWLSAVHCLL